jgi:hypothetical protein
MARRVFSNALVCVSNTLIAISLVIVSLLFGYFFSVSFAIDSASLSAAWLALAV